MIIYDTLITKNQKIKSDNFVDIKDIHNHKLPKNFIVFTTIQNSKKLIRNNSDLSKGISYPESRLYYNTYSQFIDKQSLLNDSFIILPWNMIKENYNNLINWFGQELFIRPNSPNKPFTGFDVKTQDELFFEISSRNQIENIFPDELCIITNKKQISNTEFRFWVYDSKIIGHSNYSWDDNYNMTSQEFFDNNYKFVEKTTGIMEDYLFDYVIDFCLNEDKPKIVELNAFTSSGWYDNLNINEFEKNIMRILNESD